MGNTVQSGNMLESLRGQLTEKLPSGWRIVNGTRTGRSDRLDRGADAPFEDLRTEREKSGLVLVRMKARVEPNDAAILKPAPAAASGSPVLIATPLVSTRTQERLKAMGFGYADLTGNMHLSLSEPRPFIETCGAAHNPISASRERKSLKGTKAGRNGRGLCDFRPPVGLRELA